MDEFAMREKFTPVFVKLGEMLASARDAFNRHSGASLERLKNLGGELTPEVKSVGDYLCNSAEKTPENQRAPLLRLQSVLTHLQVIGSTLEGLAAPIGRKIKDGILFSDKAVSQANQLFDHLAGILRSILDVLKTDNEFLKRYVQEEGHKLTQATKDFATEHEARLIEGLCLPQAAPIFLALLDGLGAAGHHAVIIAQILSEK